MQPPDNRPPDAGAPPPTPPAGGAPPEPGKTPDVPPATRAPGAGDEPDGSPVPAAATDAAQDRLDRGDAGDESGKTRAGYDPSEQAEALLANARWRLRGAVAVIRDAFELATGQKQLEETDLLENAHCIPRALVFVPDGARTEVGRFLQYAVTGQLSQLVATGGLSDTAKDGLAEAALLTGGGAI